MYHVRQTGLPVGSSMPKHTVDYYTSVSLLLFLFYYLVAAADGNKLYYIRSNVRGAFYPTTVWSRLVVGRLESH